MVHPTSTLSSLTVLRNHAPPCLCPCGAREHYGTTAISRRFLLSHHHILRPGDAYCNPRARNYTCERGLWDFALVPLLRKPVLPSNSTLHSSAPTSRAVPSQWSIADPSPTTLTVRCSQSPCTPKMGPLMGPVCVEGGVPCPPLTVHALSWVSHVVQFPVPEA